MNFHSQVKRNVPKLGKFFFKRHSYSKPICFEWRVSYEAITLVDFVLYLRDMRMALLGQLV